MSEQKLIYKVIWQHGGRTLSRYFESKELSAQFESKIKEAQRLLGNDHNVTTQDISLEDLNV